MFKHSVKKRMLAKQASRLRETDNPILEMVRLNK